MYRSATHAPLVRFRPIDSEDFGRRAKSLAEFLATPLLATQERLARIYGYADLHELQQRLKTKEQPGPYNDRLSSFSNVVGNDGNQESFPQWVRNAREMRDARLMRLVSEWAGESGVLVESNKLTLLCDFGLFSSPVAHRAAIKSIHAFLDGAATFTDDGFPFGFKGTLLLRYQTNLPLAPDALAGVTAAREEHTLGRLIADPVDQIAVVRRFRAPQLFREMLFHSAPEMLNGPVSVELDRDSFEEDDPADELLTADVSHMILDERVDLLEDEAGRAFTDQEYLEILRGIAEPSEEPPALWVLPREDRDFRKEVARVKLEIRRQVADLILDGDPEAPPFRRIQPAYFQLRKDNRCLSLLLEPRSDEGKTVRWAVSGTLLLLDEKTRLWSAIAVIDADYVIPGAYSDASDLIFLFENYASDDLATAWDILASDYLKRAGFRSYRKWSTRGVAAANVFLWVDPKHRGTDVSKWLIQDFVEALHPKARSQDWLWRKWTDVRELSNWDAAAAYSEEDDDYPLTLPPLGVVFLYLPDSRVRGFSLWQKEKGHAKTELFDSRDARLEQVFAKTYAKTASKEPDWAIAKRLLTITQAIPTDFVLFDDITDKESDDD